MHQNHLLSLVIVSVSFLFAIIFSLAEHSYSKLQARDVRWLRVKNDTRSAQVLELLKSRMNIVATLEFWKQFFVLAFVFSASIASVFLAQDLLSRDLSFWITFSIVFVITFVFIFLVPKMYADNHILIVARAVTPYIMVFEKIISPFVRKKPDENYTTAIELEDSDDISDSERMLYKRIVQFPQKTIKHILMPRVDIKALNQDMTFQEVQKAVSIYKHSRLPVYEDSLDKIKGILYSKDLIPFYYTEDLYWKSLLVKPLFVNIDLSLTELLDKFKSYRMHMAIVVDEFGGCLGLVTLEDLIEVILGDIYDEYDKRENLVRKIDEHTYKVDPKISLTKLGNFDTNLAYLFEAYDSQQVETLNGFIIDEFHKIPLPGDILEIGQATITIDSTAKNKINSVTITI